VWGVGLNLICREGAFPETDIQSGESFCVRSGANRLFVPRWAWWRTQSVARPHTYAVGEDLVTIAQRVMPL
jgi:hypothetical protein